MLADLWNAPHAAQAIGTATTGSSEAIQLGGLAMKRIWQEKRKAAGKSIHEPGPNIVMGAFLCTTLMCHFLAPLFLTCDVAFRRIECSSRSRKVRLSTDRLTLLSLIYTFCRFARYFEVECRLVPISEESKYRLDAKRAMEYVDENTIGSCI
jgi:glutamate decarboxylase